VDNEAWLGGILGLGLLSVVPLILTLAVIVDVAWTRRGWYWIVVALMFPVVGPIAYFLVERSPWFGVASVRVSASTAMRRGARRRLRELQLQLGHWRGPALLVEAGEALLLLGQARQAEAHLREARQQGAEPAAANLPLARALACQSRFAEAVPFLEELAEAHPDFKLGEADLALARCLDESGKPDQAEIALRRVLERHHFNEAQVRLARICLRTGRTEEARRLLETVISDAEGLPLHMQRQTRPWVRAARRLKRGRTRLPRRLTDPAAARSRVIYATAAVGISILILLALMMMLASSSAKIDETPSNPARPPRHGATTPA